MLDTKPIYKVIDILYNSFKTRLRRRNFNLNKYKDITDISELPLSLKVEDVQAILRVSRATAYDIVHSDGFPKIQYGRRIIIPKIPFINWLNSKALFGNGGIS